MADELKPCPFCGCDRINRDDCSTTQTNGDRVYCCRCGAAVEAYHGSNSARLAIEKWNTRA